MKRKLSVCILMILLFSVTSQAQDAAYVMKIAIGNPAKEANFGWTPFEVFKYELENRSQGRLQVDLSSELQGKSSMEMITMVRDGVVQARDFADGHLATIYPPIQVLSIPYLFASREIAWEVLDGPFGQRLIEDMAKTTGLRPLYWIENGGFRHYSNNKRAIHSPADMEGLKIRTMEIPLHIKIVTDLGGRAVPITWADVPEAIQAGLVDGQENSIGTFLIPHFEKIQTYLTLDGHVYGSYTLLMNDAWYQKLPLEFKQIINQAKRISAVVNRGLAVTNEIAGIQYLKSQGVEIYRPSAEEYSQFRALTRSSAVDWLRINVGDTWVDGVLEATKVAEEKLEYRE